MATLKEIAEKANVSICTVSRYLSKNSNLKQATEEKVKKAIEELNYIPNNVARSLKTRRTNNIAVVLPKINNLYYSEITSGISEVLKKHHYNLFIVEFEHHRDEEGEILLTLLENMMAGVIFLGLSGDTSFHESVAMLQQHHLPFVYANRMIPDKEYSLIYPDYRQAGELATEHLVSQGKRHLAMITQSVSRLDLQQHIGGFIGKAQEYGIEVGEHQIFRQEEHVFDQEFIHGLRQKKIDGIFATNEMTALSLLKGLLNQGVKVPEEIAVIGFGNSLLGTLATPELTTIDLQNAKLGSLSAEKLLRQIDGVEGDTITILKPHIIVRKSS